MPIGRMQLPRELKSNGGILDNVRSNIGSAQASIPTRDDMIKAGIQRQMINEGTAKPMGRRYGNMSMGYGRPNYVADRSPVQQGLKEIEIGMAPFVANRMPSQQDLSSDFFMDSITKDSKFYNPYKPTFRDQIKQGFNKYAKPVMGGIMSAISGIPGMGLLMNAFDNPDPYAQNRIDMYGAYRDPNTGFIKDKFGYNVGKTLMKNRFMEPGSNSYRSYATEALNNLVGRKWDHKRYMATGKGYGPASAKQKQLNTYYQQKYNKSFDDVMKDHQKKQNPFGDPTLGGYSGSDAGFAASQQTGGWNDQGGPVSNKTGRGRTGWSQGGIVSLWQR